MANEEKSTATETLEKGLNAASAIQGAVKTGKAIAGITKGAAAGPYGAAAALVWQNRKKLLPILMALVALFLIPVMVVMMLPSLIFGELFGDGSDADVYNVPNILNNNEAIMSNITEAENAISGILRESYDKAIAGINKEIAELPEDTLYQIIDPYADGIYFSIDLLISQYCASKNKYEDINIKDLKKTVEKGKNNLFTYTSYTVIKISEDGDGKKITVTTVTYTVKYAGDDYFADNIFNLTDEQKTLAEEYAYNLYVFLNDSYTEQSNAIHSSFEELIVKFPYEWTDDRFNSPFAGMDWKPHITSEFGNRTDPFTGKETFHTGIDIAYPKGTEIRAAKSGVVVTAEKKTTGYGYRIVINHGGGYCTLYAHCSELMVSAGDKVNAGDVIAKVGTTGRSTGNHLHFEVIFSGTVKNPRDYID